MPAKSLLESRIRERLDKARVRANDAAAKVERDRITLTYSEQDMSRLNREVILLEDLLDPACEAGGAPDNDPAGGATGEDAP